MEVEATSRQPRTCTLCKISSLALGARQQAQIPPNWASQLKKWNSLHCSYCTCLKLGQPKLFQHIIHNNTVVVNEPEPTDTMVLNNIPGILLLGYFLDKLRHHEEQYGIKLTLRYSKNFCTSIYGRQSHMVWSDSHHTQLLNNLVCWEHK